jgi:transcriptional regulator with XRE-family HTH domain
MHGAGNNQNFQKLIGGKLKALRRQAGLSQRGLALKLDISHQQIQKYERGDNAMPLQRIKSFAEALGVDPAILAFPEDDPPAIGPETSLGPERSELVRLYDGLPTRESRSRLLGFLRSLGTFVKKLV